MLLQYITVWESPVTNYILFFILIVWYCAFQCKWTSRLTWLIKTYDLLKKIIFIRKFSVQIMHLEFWLSNWLLEGTFTVETCLAIFRTPTKRWRPLWLSLLQKGWVWLHFHFCVCVLICIYISEIMVWSGQVREIIFLSWKFLFLRDFNYQTCSIFFSSYLS